MPLPPNYLNGSVAKRAKLALLTSCTNEEIAKLFTKKYIAMSTPRGRWDIKYSALDEIFSMTGTSISKLFFDVDTLPAPVYTKYDNDVIAKANTLTPMQRMFFLHTFRALYDYDWAVTMPITNPVERIREFNKHNSPPTRVPGTSREFQPDKPYWLDVEPDEQLRRMRLAPASKNIMSDYLPDVALAWEVSLHWILGLKDTPMYCATSAAEWIFDLYTIIPRQLQGIYRAMLETAAHQGEEVRI